MADPVTPTPSLIPGRLPTGFCPASEQERLEAFARAMTVSGSTGKKGDPGRPGGNGTNGVSPVIAFGSESEEVNLDEGDSGTVFVAPAGINAELVVVAPVNLGTIAISSVMISGQLVTVALTAALGASSEERLLRFTWPTYTVTYPTA